MNKMHKQYAKAKKNGISNNDLLRMKEIARKQAELAVGNGRTSIFAYVSHPIKYTIPRILAENSQEKSPEIH